MRAIENQASKYYLNGFFRFVVFSDLLLSSSAADNQDTLDFVNETVSYYTQGGGRGVDWMDGIDVVVILGNVINGTDWDGQDSSYFEDRWDSIM